jgi:hypothetical protein
VTLSSGVTRALDTNNNQPQLPTSQEKHHVRIIIWGE